MKVPNHTDGQFSLSTITIQEFESLFHEYYQWLCLQAFKIADDWPASEDIVQEFFTKCWQNRSAIVIRESWKAFALRSVKNAALNYLKKEDRRMKHETASGPAGAMNGNLPPDNQADAADERYLRLLQAIDQMPEQRKKVFLLSLDSTYAEVANELNISINTVKMHLKLAYNELRNMIPWLLLFLKLFIKK
jgi:RNA polymerase sigma-70 factor (ECF subfamily)